MQLGSLTTLGVFVTRWQHHTHTVCVFRLQCCLTDNLWSAEHAASHIKVRRRPDQINWTDSVPEYQSACSVLRESKMRAASVMTDRQLEMMPQACDLAMCSSEVDADVIMIMMNASPGCRIASSQMQGLRRH
jgi:hypothetical protein